MKIYVWVLTVNFVFCLRVSFCCYDDAFCKQINRINGKEKTIANTYIRIHIKLTHIWTWTGRGHMSFWIGFNSEMYRCLVYYALILHPFTVFSPIRIVNINRDKISAYRWVLIMLMYTMDNLRLQIVWNLSVKCCTLLGQVLFRLNGNWFTITCLASCMHN